MRRRNGWVGSDVDQSEAGAKLGRKINLRLWHCTLCKTASDWWMHEIWNVFWHNCILHKPNCEGGAACRPGRGRTANSLLRHQKKWGYDRIAFNLRVQTLSKIIQSHVLTQKTWCIFSIFYCGGRLSWSRESCTILEGRHALWSAQLALLQKYFVQQCVNMHDSLR